MRQFRGLWPVMLTAFHDDGRVDLPGVEVLTDFYLDNGSHGLFAVCQSSEMYDLTDDERIAIAETVVKRTDGRVPVVATATFGGPVAQQAAFVQRMAGTGVDAVVVLPNQLSAVDEDESALQPRLEQLVEQTDPVPLGLYECPKPYHRTLSPELTRWAAGTGRFRYIKDTTRVPARIEEKIAAVQGSRLALFNAAPASAQASLRLGAAGVSPVAANLFPELFAWLCDNCQGDHADHPKAAWLQSRITLFDGTVRHKYPQSAKRFLATHRGLSIGAHTRVEEHPWDDYDDLLHATLADELAAVRQELGIA